MATDNNPKSNSVKKNLEKQTIQQREQIQELEERLKQAEIVADISMKDNFMGWWEVDLVNNKQSWSENYCRLLGYDKKIAEPSDELFLSHVHEDDLESVKSSMQNCLASKSPCSLEFKYIPKGGSVKFAKSTANYLLDDEKNVVKIIGVFHDITDHKVIVSKLADSEQKYKSLYENAPLSYQSLDIDGNFIDINPTWLSTLGYDREEVIGKNFGDFLHPDWKGHFQKNFPAFKKRGYVSDVRFRMKHKEGHYIYISFEGCIGTHPDGSFKQTYCVFKDITEQKGVEDSLKKNQFYLSKAQEIGKVGTWELDIVNNKLYWTEQNYKNFGIPPETELTYEIFLNCIHPEEREYVNREWAAAIKGKPYDIEHRVVANGKVKWLREKADIQFDKNGNAVSAIGFTQDITSYKKSVIRQLENEKKFRSTIESSPLGILLYSLEDDDQLIFKGFNNSAEEILKVKLTHNIGKTIEEAFPGLAETEIPAAYKKVARTGEVYSSNQINYEYDEISGAYYVRAYQISPNNLAVNFDDVTEKLKREEEIENSRHKFKSLFDNVEEGIALHKMIFDENDELVDFLWVDINPKYEELTQLKKEDLIGKRSRDVIPNIEKKWYDLYTRVVKTGVPETMVDHSEYLNKYWEVKAFRPEEGHFAVAMTDVTERMASQNKILEAKKKAEESDRLKTAFLSNMSHEIRTPMNGIIGFTELLQSPDTNEQNQKEYLKIIKKSGDRLLNTVNDIIEISKIESGVIVISKKPLDIVQYLYNVVVFFRPECERKGLRIILNNDNVGNRLLLNTDKTKLNSIITNLIKNAIKFTESGYIRTGLNITDNKLIFYCEDTGIGIPEDRQNAVFNRFEQADIDDKRVLQGSGLGLAIVKSYVEMLDGDIWVESVEDEGSVFYVSFPLESELNSENSQEKFNQSRLLSEKDIIALIAEDDETSSTHLSVISKKLFQRVKIVSNGKAAVEEIKNNASYNLILMDIKMPVMDGLEATRKIREFNKDVTIIAQTAFAFEEDKRKILDAGCNDVIAKPINMDVLINKLSPHFSE